LNGGVVFAELTEEASFSFQTSILRTILSIEDTFINLAKLNAKNGIKSIVITDRGTMDPSAYMPREGWLKLLNVLKLQESALRDHRYDAVIHLVTAADNAEAFYQTENNSARSEGIESARKLDKLVLNAWVGHNYLSIIDNSTDFAQKCNRAVETVLNRLGLSDKRFGKNIKKHKYLLFNFDLNKEFPVAFRDFNVEHVFLSNSKNKDTYQIRIRKRAQLSSSIAPDSHVSSLHFNMTIRSPEVDGQIVETRRHLNGREYEALKGQANPSRYIIHKRRRCFNWENTYFQIDVFQPPCNQGLVLLEAYLDHSSGNNLSQLIPNWLQFQDVTGDPKYSLFELAKK
jgi:CYTH domain-containing protein